MSVTPALGNGPRFEARPVMTGGTPTATWRGWGRDFPSLDLDDCPGLVLVAPHPDDETLGLGATAATLRARGVPVQVVSVTDGGGAYPGISRLERSWLERDRRAELRRATDILGLDEAISLGLPDGELAAHQSRLADLIVELLEAGPTGAWCAASWRGDGHPDHEAVGRAAAEAAHRVGATLLEYPVWMWHWAVPDDDDVPWHRMLTVPVTRAAVARKQHAANVFRTQLTPYEPELDEVLPRFVVQRLMAIGELVFR